MQVYIWFHLDQSGSPLTAGQWAAQPFLSELGLVGLKDFRIGIVVSDKWLVVSEQRRITTYLYCPTSLNVAHGRVKTLFPYFQ